MKPILLSLFLSFSFVAGAHEGHSHGPAIKAAPHGGVLREGKDNAVEVVADNNEIKVYVFDMQMKPVALNGMSLAGTAQVPRKDKKALAFQTAGDYFKGNADVGSAYRYELNLELNNGKNTEKFKMNIEIKE